MSSDPQSRRGFVAAVAGSALSFLMADPVRASSIGGRQGALAATAVKHPDPRPGVDASHVLPAEKVGADVRELYDHIREIPQVADGIRCQCGCAELDGYYSLLSCYEESGMAEDCVVCRRVGALVYRLHEDGRTLDEIRAAVDRRSW
jgi:hypothetical protein